MDAMKEWTQVGPVWQRVYPNGDLCVVRKFNQSDGGTWTSERFESGGGLDRLPVSIKCDRDSPDALKAALDNRFDPQPELCDRTEYATYFRHGKRSAFVAKGSYAWSAWKNASEFVPGGRDCCSREQAEAAAKFYVLGNS